MKTKKSQAWITVFGQVNEFMERNLEKWNTIDEIRRTYDDFINNLRKLRELQPELEQDLEPIRDELSDKRALLEGKLFPIGNILEVYSNDNSTAKKARSLVSEWKKLESLRQTIGGKKLRVELIVTPFKKRGVTVGAIESFRDVTNRKEAEEELRSIYMEMSVGMSEVFEALKRISSGDIHPQQKTICCSAEESVTDILFWK